MKRVLSPRRPCCFERSQPVPSELITSKKREAGVPSNGEADVTMEDT